MNSNDNLPSRQVHSNVPKRAPVMNKDLGNSSGNSSMTGTQPTATAIVRSPARKNVQLANLNQNQIQNQFQHQTQPYQQYQQNQSVTSISQHQYPQQDDEMIYEDPSFSQSDYNVSQHQNLHRHQQQHFANPQFQNGPISSNTFAHQPQNQKLLAQQQQQQFNQIELQNKSREFQQQQQHQAQTAYQPPPPASNEVTATNPSLSQEHQQMVLASAFGSQDIAGMLDMMGGTQDTMAFFAFANVLRARRDEQSKKIENLVRNTYKFFCNIYLLPKLLD